MTACLIGAGGQDGRLLHSHLIRKGVDVKAINRGDLDLCDIEAVSKLVSSMPQEVYYLAAYHHSSQDGATPNELDLFRSSLDVHVSGFACFLEAIRLHSPTTRIFYAGSSLVFGDHESEMINEAAPFSPRCIYGMTKAGGLQLCRYYREKHGIFAAGGILFNHESPLRHTKFVIPKIIRAAKAIAQGSPEKLSLGNLSARVDWGFAPDYIDAMARILRLANPSDYVIATGETHSVQEVVKFVFAHLGLDWHAHIEESPDILTRQRTPLCGDASRLRGETNWKPTVTFYEMLRILMDADHAFNRSHLGHHENLPTNFNN